MSKLYYCGEDQCPGHSSFAVTCSSPLDYDYPVLERFRKIADVQPIPPTSPETKREPALAGSNGNGKTHRNGTGKLKDYKSFGLWTKKQVKLS